MGQAVNRSNRLTFEPLHVRHAERLVDVLTDPRVNEHFPEGGPDGLADLIETFAYRINGPGTRHEGEIWLDFIVRIKGSGNYIGRVEATIQGTHAELAYLLGPEFWHRGYGREATRWLEGVCIDQHGVQTLWAAVTPSNTRSVALLTALGYSRTEKPQGFSLLSYDDGDLVFTRPAVRLAGQSNAANDGTSGPHAPPP